MVVFDAVRSAGSSMIAGNVWKWLQDYGPGAAGERRVGEAAAPAVGRVRELAFREWDGLVSDVCRRLAKHSGDSELATEGGVTGEKEV